MVKKSVAGYDPFGSANAHAGKIFYSKKDIDKMISIAGEPLLLPQEEFRKELELLAHHMLSHHERQKKPTPTQLKKDLIKIGGAAKKLILALEGSGNSRQKTMPPALRLGTIQAYAALEAQELREDISGKEYLEATINSVLKLREAVDSAYRLQDWASKSSAREDTKAQIQGKNATQNGVSAKAKNVSNDALNNWIWTLAGTWSLVFGLRATTTVIVGNANEGKASGRFIEFVHACAEPLEINDLTGDAIRDRLRNHNKK